MSVTGQNLTAFVTEYADAVRKMARRRIAVVSVGRSDRGHLAPVLDTLGDDGMLVDWPGCAALADTPKDVTRCLSTAITWFGSQWERLAPDLILLFGDRYEMLAAAIASLPFAIPLAHLHGGEVTIGAFDNQIRNAITKMAHIHLVSHPHHAARVRQMGEKKWRIHVTGAPGVDRLEKFSIRTGIGRMILVTLHPCTLEYQQTTDITQALIKALGKHDVIWTAANADTYGSRINAAMTASFGSPATPTDDEYLGLMAYAAVMVGNSSSGIIEAPSFRLPVVNIGNRQKGRLRGDNVIDVGTTAEKITHGIRRALDPEFRAALSGVNPYGDGHAAPRIAEILRTVPLDRRLMEKR